MKSVRITVLSVCFAVLTACSGGWGGEDEYYRPNLPDHPVTKVQASGGSATTESSDAGSDAGASSTGGASSVEEGGSSGTIEVATGGAVQVILY